MPCLSSFQLMRKEKRELTLLEDQKDNGQVCFCMGLSHGLNSKIVDCNDIWPNSIRTESQKGVIKENHNGVSSDIKDNKCDTDKLFNVTNDEDGWIASKFNCSMYDNEKEITDFVAPISSSHCSLTTQSFEKDSVIHIEKSVMEHKLPELMVCYEENTYDVIKDICVDDAMPSQGKFLFDTDVDETTPYSFFSLGKDINSVNPKERVDINMSVPEVVKSLAGREKVNLPWPLPYSDKKGLQKGLPPDFGCKVSTLGGEVKDVATDAFKENFPLRDFLSVPELNKELSDFKSSIESMVEAKEQSLQRPTEVTILAPNSASENSSEEAISGNSPSVSRSDESDHSPAEGTTLATAAMNSPTDDSDLDHNEAVLSKASMICAVDKSDNRVHVAKISHAVDSVPEKSTNIVTDELSYDSKLETGSITFVFDSSASAASKEQTNPQNIDSEICVTDKSLKLEDSNVVPVLSQLQQSQGESSFSATGPLSGPITYSGPIAYSGSLSHRSDSSTTSTRSFAFPILQSEWNSSPVRMTKADRRHMQKHRTWRECFSCCRF